MAAVAVCGFLAHAPAAQAETFSCTIAPQLSTLAHPLPQVAARLASDKPLLVIAIGSSSTAGFGASSPAFNYPNQLAKKLSDDFHHPVTVINRGVGGDEIDRMMKRFDAALSETPDGKPLDAKPDLVLWQVGSNEILRGHPLPAAQLHEGLEKIRATGADAVLIDPQYAPSTFAKPGAVSIVDSIAGTAASEHVGLFHRFALMKQWSASQDFAAFVTPDGIHMNDAGYGCWAVNLAFGIENAAGRPIPRIAASKETGAVP